MNDETYYKLSPVLFKIGRRTKGRELALLGKPTIRCLKAHNSNYVKTHFKKYNVGKNPVNIYHSISHLNNIPCFTYDLAKRLLQQQDFFKNYDSYVKNYDFVIDFDHEDIKISWADMFRVHKLLLDYDVQHEVIFSGKKGFHIEVKWLKPIKTTKEYYDRIKLFGDFALFLKKFLFLETLDDGIYDAVRIWKCPWSIDYRTGLVVKPLTIEEINNFTIDYCKPDVVIKKIYKLPEYIYHGSDPNNLFIMIDELTNNKGEIKCH